MKPDPKIKSAVPDLDPTRRQANHKRFADLCIEDQEACAKKLVESVKQISNPHRLLVLAQLTEKDHPVCELQALLKRSQPSVSNDLVLLRNLELIKSKRRGNKMCNHLEDQKRETVIQLLDLLL